MNDASDFLAAILDRPLDDAPRLILADWLDENGQADRARFIRAQVNARDREAAGVGSLRVMTGLWHKMADIEPWTLVRDRVTVPTVVTLANTGKTRVQFRRGFVDRVWVPAGMFMARAEEVFAKHPITAVKITNPFAIIPSGGRTWQFDWDARGLIDRVKKNTFDGPDPWARFDIAKCPTTAAAEAVLSDLLVAYGRALAGLGPL
jgi:uncharacterized protein (TIGR02996 family)